MNTSKRVLHVASFCPLYAVLFLSACFSERVSLPLLFLIA